MEQEFQTTKLYGFLKHILNIPVTSVIILTASISYGRTTNHKISVAYDKYIFPMCLWLSG